MDKQALVWLMKNHTFVTGKWIADRLEMGHLSTASVAINRFARDQSYEARRIRKLLSE